MSHYTTKVLPVGKKGVRIWMGIKNPGTEPVEIAILSTPDLLWSQLSNPLGGLQDSRYFCER
jgi:hypothetical protein